MNFSYFCGENNLAAKRCGMAPGDPRVPEMARTSRSTEASLSLAYQKTEGSIFAFDRLRFFNFFSGFVDVPLRKSYTFFGSAMCGVLVCVHIVLDRVYIMHVCMWRGD